MYNNYIMGIILQKSTLFLARVYLKFIIVYGIV